MHVLGRAQNRDVNIEIIQFVGPIQESWLESVRAAGATPIHYIANNTTVPFRALWTPLPDGRVRQFFEQYDAENETWAVWFEGFYTRKSESSEKEKD